MKGQAVIILGIFVIGAVALTEFIYLSSMIQKTQPIVQIVRETEIIRGINRLEFAKQYLLKSALYSYYQASYDVANRGGFSDLSTNSYNCIPYWKIYSQDNSPDLQTNMKNFISAVFTKYITTANFEDVTIPTFFTVDISNHQTLTINSDSTLQVGSQDFYTAEELFSFSQPVDGRIFELFSIAQNVDDAVTALQKVVVLYPDLQNQPGSKLNLLQNTLNDVLYASQNVQINFQSENLGPNDFNYSARILVTITDTSAQYPAYDFTTKSLAERNLNFQFYMLLGNANVPAPTNSCENINY
jgi:hypothetical protein